MTDYANRFRGVNLVGLFTALEMEICDEDEMLALIKIRLRESTLPEIATVPVDTLRRYASRIGIAL